MRIDKSLDIRDRLEGELRSIYADAIRNNRHAHEIAVALKNRVWSSPGYARLPAWAKSHLTGYQKAQMDVLYRDWLEWRVSLDGEFMPGENVPKGQWDRIETGNFFWRCTETPFVVDADDA
jgi:hypothetical protein